MHHQNSARIEAAEKPGHVIYFFLLMASLSTEKRDTFIDVPFCLLFISLSFVGCSIIWPSQAHLASLDVSLTHWTTLMPNVLLPPSYHSTLSDQVFSHLAPKPPNTLPLPTVQQKLETAQYMRIHRKMTFHLSFLYAHYCLLSSLVLLSCLTHAVCCFHNSMTPVCVTACNH